MSNDVYCVGCFLNAELNVKLMSSFYTRPSRDNQYSSRYFINQQIVNKVCTARNDVADNININSSGKSSTARVNTGSDLESSVGGRPGRPGRVGPGRGRAGQANGGTVLF